MTNNLFVYGTLRLGYSNQYAVLLHAASTFLGTARMAGHLEQAGEYTGMRPARSGGDWVEGEVFAIHDSDAIFKQLDEYEGADYVRWLQAAVLADGETVECWVYLHLPQVVHSADQT